MRLTPRQRQVLQLVTDDLKHGRNWTERALSSFAGEMGTRKRITWDEMLWLSDIEQQGMATRIEAMLIVDDAWFRANPFQHPSPTIGEHNG